MAPFSDPTSRICQLLELSGLRAASGDMKDDADLVRKLQSRGMGITSLKALHEASTEKSKMTGQAVVFVVESKRRVERGLGQEAGHELRITALNGVRGSLILGSDAGRHQFIQKGCALDFFIGQVLLVFSPKVVLASETRKMIRNGNITKHTFEDVELIVEKQADIVHLGKANDIERCGASTKKDTECKIIVNKHRGRHCLYHAHGSSKADQIRSQAFQEVFNEINLEKNKEGLSNVEGQNRLQNQNQNQNRPNQANGGGGVNGNNSLLARRPTAPSARQEMAINLTRGTSHRKENIEASLSASSMRSERGANASMGQGRNHEGTHSSTSAVAMPFNGPTSSSSYSMGAGAQGAALRRAGYSVQKVDAVKAVGAGAGAAGGGAGGRRPSAAPRTGTAAAGTKRAPGVSDASGLGEEEEGTETEQEKALLGSGREAMDGAVKVPSQSRTFDKCNQQYRHQARDRGGGGGGGGDPIVSAKAQNGILNGRAGAARQAELDRRRHGSDRQFSAQSKISREHGNRKMGEDQIKRRKLGAEGHKLQTQQRLQQEKEQQRRQFNHGYAMSGSVLIDQKKLNANAEAYAPPKAKAAQKDHAARQKRKKEEEDAEIEALLSRKSTHASEEEDEWMEEFKAKMKKLEAQEYFAVKANEATFIKIAAFHCVNCDFTTEDSPTLCRSKGHLVKMTKAIKRYFECRTCPTSRTHTMGDLVPSKTCQQCGRLSWKPCGSRGSAATGGTRQAGAMCRPSSGLVVSGSEYTTRSGTDALASRVRDLDK